MQATAATMAASDHVWQWDAGSKNATNAHWKSFDTQVNEQLQRAFASSGDKMRANVTIHGHSYLVLKDRKGFRQIRTDEPDLWRAVRHVPQLDVARPGHRGAVGAPRD